MLNRNWNYKVTIPSKIMLPFFVLIALWAFIPTILIPQFYILSIPIKANELSLFVIVLPYMLLLIGNKYFSKNWRNYTSIIIFLSITLYSIFSLIGSSVSYSDRGGAYVTIIYFTCSFAFAYLFVIFSRLDSRYIKWLTLLITVIAALYLAQSLFSLGLRATVFTSYGIDRVKGPLFNAATGQLILLPAIGFLLNEIINHKRRGLMNIVSVFILFSTILGLGSRSGIISLIVLILISFLSIKNWRRKLTLFVVTLVISVLSFSLVFSKADSTRLTNLEDQSRETNFETAKYIFSKEDTAQKILGRGLASTWPWYMSDTEATNSTRGGNLRRTDDGTLLYHPHSTLLFFIVELGLAGTSLLLILVILIFNKLFKDIFIGGNIFLGAAIVSTFVSNLLDFFLFKNFILSSIWLIYIVYYLSSNISMKKSIR